MEIGCVGVQLQCFLLGDIGVVLIGAGAGDGAQAELLSLFIGLCGKIAGQGVIGPTVRPIRFMGTMAN